LISLAKLILQDGFLRKKVPTTDALTSSGILAILENRMSRFRFVPNQNWLQTLALSRLREAEVPSRFDGLKQASPAREATLPSCLITLKGESCCGGGG